MKGQLQRLLIALLLTGAVWAAFSWPLPRYVTEGIPAGAIKRTGEPTIQRMIPGDHLQLLYHFWLLGDMLSGTTPWFHNLYEFNTGSDAERYEPGSYYVPFSLLYALGSALAGRAFGWNFSGFVSLWLTLFFTHSLVRRYLGHSALTWAISLVSILLPYRWLSLTGGSPTGFAMACVPALLLGLDAAVKDDRWGGGLLAGLALLMAAWSDAHVFFFSALVAPCWCAIAFAHREGFAWKRPAAYLRTAAALLPVAILGGLAFWSSQTTAAHIETSRTNQGRTLGEIALFSPKPEGLWSWQEHGISNHIYFGAIAAGLLALGLLAWVVRLARQPRASARRALVFLGLALGIAGIVCLSMGPYGPFEGRALTAARKLIPPYQMIRQPAKAYCLLPSLLAVAGALGVGALGLRGAAGSAAALLLALGMGWEYRRQIHPVICLLDHEQAAYRAVAAAPSSGKPLALVITLWPGDSHYTSIYQYYASLYHLRLVNGYRPFVAQRYIEDIFRPFESANQGILDAGQLNRLLKRRVEFLIFHEDLFPEKVSPFPVGFALRHLLNNPRLELLRQEGPVWAFRIRPTPGGVGDLGSTWRTFFPARRIEFERAKLSDAAPAAPADPDGTAFLRLAAGGPTATFKPVFTVDAPALRWLVRVRGKGALEFARFTGDREAGVIPMGVATTGWQWRVMPWSPFDGYRSIYFKVHALEGAVDCDQALLVAGDWDPVANQGRYRLPAPAFFHAGHTDLENDRVVFLPGRDRQDLVFYGPKLPVPPGSYRIDLTFDSTAPSGTALGTCIVACPEDREVARFELNAGSPAGVDVDLENNLPLLIAVQFAGRGDLRISDVEVKKK